MFGFRKNITLTRERDLQIDHFDITTCIQQDIKQAQDDRDRKRLIQWLANSIPDPSREHNAARSNYEESTGSWLIDSKKLRSWSNTSNSFLWLNGGRKFQSAVLRLW
jgi:hypothetical protein